MKIIINFKKTFLILAKYFINPIYCARLKYLFVSKLLNGLIILIILFVVHGFDEKAILNL